MSSHDAPQPNAGLIYRLKALPQAGAVLHLGAHPDDEDAGMIAYMSRGLGVRTVYWSATRGESGQNRDGPDRAEALGIIRTWESLDAGEVDGGEVLYGPFYDFGFSKSGQNALAKWGRTDVVREVVRAIRAVQPHVVVSRWSGGPGDGHGHHQAIGLVMGEAFDAAGDPSMFPELRRQGLAPWRPSKLYHSMEGDWQPGEDVALGELVPEFERDGVLRLNTGAFDPVSGRTFQELANLATGRHRTQAMAFLPEPGGYYFYYGLDRTSVPVPPRESSLLDGLDPTIEVLGSYSPGLEELGECLAQVRAHADVALQEFHPDRPDAAGRHVLRALHVLREGLSVLDAAPIDQNDGAALRTYLLRKSRAFEDTAVRCFGLRLECLLSASRISPGGSVGVTARLWHQGGGKVEMVDTRLSAPSGWSIEEPPGGGRPSPPEVEVAAETDALVTAAPDAAFSTPYWLREPRTPYRYTWPDGGPLGRPLDDPLIRARSELQVEGHRLVVEAPAVRRETFVGGFRELPLAIVPALSLEPRQRLEILAASDRKQQLALQTTARGTRAGAAKATLSVRIPPGWSVVPDRVDLSFSEGGESASPHFDVTIPPGAAAGSYELSFEEVTNGERREGVVVRAVRQRAPGVGRIADESNCIAEVFVVAPAKVSIRVLDVRFIPGLRYGYLQGADEEIVPSLRHFGVDVRLLSTDDLQYGDLATFDAIVVGVNAYLVRADLRKNAGRLLQYVEGGGTLIVQYQGYGYDADGFAPYPFRYNQPHDRVTFPDAPVEILRPEHPIMHLPNELGPKDFEGWVHDRGLYFFGQWDRRYNPILASSDPGEEPKAGGLVVAPHGRGNYVYAAYSFFRQIPAGVPGAVRLFANLLGLAEATIRDRMERARKIELLSFMSDEQLHEVVRLMSERWFDDGQYLAREGEAGDELFLVLSGEVEVLTGGESGWQAITITEGNAVGELAVLAGLPRSASLRARGEVKVLAMGGEHFRRLLLEQRDLGEGVIRMLARRLAATMEGLRAPRSG